MMRRLLSLALLAVLPLAAWSQSTSVNDVEVDVVLAHDGSARITEVWDVKAYDITEWYLARQNLGDIDITGLEVRDEKGQNFVNEGEWNINRSISQKAGRCGMVTKSDGYELCWGVGSHGPHVFTVSYTMTNVVKSMDDYDMIHMQFITPLRNSPSKHAKVSLTLADGTPVDTTFARIWGFGYEGTQGFADGAAFVETSRKMSSSSSMIVLMRFDKGYFSSPSVRAGSFQTVLDKALDGADFGKDDAFDWTLENVIYLILGLFIFFLPILLPIWLVIRAVKKKLGLDKMNRRQRRKFLGAKDSDITWRRDAPFDGNLLDAEYVLKKLEGSSRKNYMACAMILDMLQKNCLLVSRDAKDKVEISFNESADKSVLFPEEVSLYNMMKKASGKDVILQDKEFSRWSQSNTKEVSDWLKSIESSSRKSMVTGGFLEGTKLTESGRAEARGVVAFRNFLKDFTLVDERKSVEVAVWQQYLVYGALFGIADKVAKELKDIDPKIYEQVVVYDYTTLSNVIYMTNALSRAITNANYVAPVRSYGGFSGTSSGSWGGFGGHSSFGGGGGFSGGGFSSGGR